MDSMDIILKIKTFIILMNPTMEILTLEIQLCVTNYLGELLMITQWISDYSIQVIIKAHGQNVDGTQLMKVFLNSGELHH